VANIKIDDLAAEIARELGEYTEEIQEEVEDATNKVTRDLVKELKQNSPRQTGSYAEGWTRTKFREGTVVHNKTDYQLTHLLEHGHAKKGGGRVAARVHIRPAEEKAVKTFTERVEGVIKR
jgi:hypothetical protein